MRPTLRKLGPLGLWLAASAILPLIGSGALVALTPTLEPWLSSHGLGGTVLFVLVFALLAGLACINTQVAALFAGYTIGFGGGMVASVSAIVLAAWIGYTIATRISGQRLLDAIESSDNARAVHALLLREGRGAFTTTALLRVSPLVPFASVNVLLAAARVAFPPFWWGTCLGVLPRTALVVFTGAELARFDPDAPLDQKLRLGLAVLATLSLMVWLGVVARRALLQAPKRDEIRS